MPLYELDPDFRRDVPDSGPFCCRCQKAITSLQSALTVTVNWDTWLVKKDIKGKALIGKDCWKKITA